MNTKLIAVVAVSAFATLSSPAFAQDEAIGAQAYGRTYAPAAHRTSAFRGAHAAVRSDFTSNGWVGEGPLDRSRPGTIDPDLRPAGS